MCGCDQSPVSRQEVNEGSDGDTKPSVHLKESFHSYSFIIKSNPHIMANWCYLEGEKAAFIVSSNIIDMRDSGNFTI